MTASPTLRRALTDVAAFSRLFLPRWELRPYQTAPAQAIFDRVGRRSGDQLGIVFSRQSGKDELLAQVLAALLVRHSRSGGSIVVAAPTHRPQARISRDRLWHRLRSHPLLASLATASEATIAVGEARVTFVSAAPTANARGQTADLLLVANEAQDILTDTWDAVFDPMAASTNAPTLVTAGFEPANAKGPPGTLPNRLSHHAVPSGQGGLTSTQNRACPTPCFSTVTRTPSRCSSSRFCSYPHSFTRST